jgi:hypothetical protein
MSSFSSSKQRVRKNLISSSELAVLRTLRHRSTEADEATSEVADIASAIGIHDNDEVWRALYSLEGKNLVKPYPAGDFTSHHWAITDIGVKAVELLNI